MAIDGLSLDLQLDRDMLELATVCAAAAALLSLLLALAALARLRALSRRVRRLAAAPSPATPVAPEDPSALRHVGVVRYDAFGDLAGRLSFSTAVFDDRGDGFVLSSINSRSETRTYAKSLTRLRSDQHLSPEEEQAISAARDKTAET